MRILVGILAFVLCYSCANPLAYNPKATASPKPTVASLSVVATEVPILLGDPSFNGCYLYKGYETQQFIFNGTSKAQSYHSWYSSLSSSYNTIYIIVYDNYYYMRRWGYITDSWWDFGEYVWNADGSFTLLPGTLYLTARTFKKIPLPAY